MLPQQAEEEEEEQLSSFIDLAKKFCEINKQQL